MNTIAVYQQIVRIKQLTVTAVDIIDKEIIIHCHTNTESPICPTCRNAAQAVDAPILLRVRDHDLSLRTTWLSIKVRQCHCDKCGETQIEALSFLDKNRQSTARYVKSATAALNANR